MFLIRFLKNEPHTELMRGSYFGWWPFYMTFKTYRRSELPENNLITERLIRRLKQKKSHHVKLLNRLFCYHSFCSFGTFILKVSLGSQLVQCVFIFFMRCALICGSCCKFGPKWNVNSLYRNSKSSPFQSFCRKSISCEESVKIFMVNISMEETPPTFLASWKKILYCYAIQIKFALLKCNKYNYVLG